jgi:hypothetical protein
MKTRNPEYLVDMVVKTMTADSHRHGMTTNPRSPDKIGKKKSSNLVVKTMTVASRRHGMTIIPHSEDKIEKKKSSNLTQMNSFVPVISELSPVNINPGSNRDSNREHKIAHSHPRNEDGPQWMNRGRGALQSLGFTG